MSDKRLTIALDYDDTFTANTRLFSRFIVDADLANVEIVCISSRRGTFEARRELEAALGPTVKVYFAYDMPKKLYAEKYGIGVDIWIDDNPASLFERVQ